VSDPEIEYAPIAREHVEGAMRLCAIEGYDSYTAGAERTWTALTAPGVATVVALSGGEVAGFAQMQSNGVIQAHLTLIVVARSLRRAGIGKRLVGEAFARRGGTRVDLLSTEGADGFYRSFRYQQFPGYRIYPAYRQADLRS
jgi:ribosomal protein S18 acetylase RimI-like enzyme